MGAWLREFSAGLILPARILSGALADPHLRGRYLRAVAVQIGATILLFFTMCCVWSSPILDLGDSVRSGELRDALDEAGTLLAMMYVSQWIVLALSRDYTDQLSRRLSVGCGLPPEEMERNPNVRIDVRWMKKKLRRRLRATYLYLVGLPAIGLVSLPVGFALSWVSRGDTIAYSVLAFAWSAYWAVVGVTSKTAYAWNEPPPAFQPWFMRVLARVERYAIVRWYVRWVRKATTSVRAPTVIFEQAPLPLFGLAVARALTGAPLLSIFVRPLVPVAVAEIFKQAGVPLAVPVNEASAGRASTS